MGILLGALLIALVCGTYAHTEGYTVAACIAVIIVLGLVWPAVTIWGVHGSVSFGTARVREGESVRVVLKLGNRWPWPAYGLAVSGGWQRDEKPAIEGTRLAPAFQQAVAWGWRTTEASWELRPVSRGDYPLRPPRVECGFPFGLWHASRFLTIERRLIVWPRRVPVREFADSIGERYFDGDHLQEKAGTAGEVLGVRRYRPGDPLRRIHWGQTAKHDRLIVCEQRSTCAPWLRILLDARLAVHAGTGADSSREWAIRIAAGLAEAAWQRGTGVELVVGEQVVTGSHRAVLDTLARVPGVVPGSLEELQARAEATASNGRVVQLLVTTDAALAESTNTPRGAQLVVLRIAGFAAGTDREADRSSLTSALSARHHWWVIAGPLAHAKEKALLSSATAESAHAV